MYNFKNQKYIDYVCILSVLAQCAIDNAKRTFDVDLVGEIERIKNDMNLDKNGYPLFWKQVKDKKCKIGDKRFDVQKINKELKCPMNYLMELKFENFRSSESTLPMEHFFNNFELKEDRRKSRRVEELIEQYSLDLYNNRIYSECEQSEYLLLRSDFEELLEDIKMIYISKDYIGLMSWLIDRAFCISPTLKSNKNNTNSKTCENKSLLIKILYSINSKNVLKIFSKNS